MCSLRMRSECIDSVSASYRHWHNGLFRGRSPWSSFSRKSSPLDRLVLRPHTRHEPHLHESVSSSLGVVGSKLLSLALIATKIWTINSFTAAHVVENKMRPVLFVILESGAIYSCTLLTLLGTYLAQSWAQYLLLDAVRLFLHFSN